MSRKLSRALAAATARESAPPPDSGDHDGITAGTRRRSGLGSLTFKDYDGAAAALRRRLGLGRLTPGLAGEVRAAVARHGARLARRTAETAADRPGIERLRRRLLAEVHSAVEPHVDRLFRAASSFWAGGYTTDSVVIGPDPEAGVETYRVWSHNGRWSGTDIVRRVTVMPAWRRWVEARGLAELDGLLTTHAVPVTVAGDVEVYRAGWVRQGRGYELRAERGYLAYHRPSGTAYHLSTVSGEGPAQDEPLLAAKAAAGLRRKLKSLAISPEEKVARQAARAVAQARRRATDLDRLVEKIAGWDLDDIRDVVVTIGDSLAAGNCKAGTLAFCDRYFSGRTRASIGEIAGRFGGLGLAILDADELRLMRQVAAACLHAIRRHRIARRSAGI